MTTQTVINEQQNVITAQDKQVAELLADPDISVEKKALLDEAAELLKKAQDALDDAQKALDDGDEEEAIAKLAESVGYSSEAAAKIKQALELD